MGDEYIEKKDALAINLTFEVDAVPSRSRRAVLKACKAGAAVKAYAEYIRSIPPADVKPVARGEWVFGYELNEDYEVICCSCCGGRVHKQKSLKRMPNFCADCGADMRGETQAFDKDINVTIKTDKEEGPE